MNIAFIGLGVMGNPMCVNLLQSGRFRISVHDIDRSRTDNLVAMGASRAASVAEAVAGADRVLTSLPGPEQVRQVAVEPAGLFDSMGDGAVWIDFSTNSLEVCDMLVARAGKRNIGFLDAPVSGGDEGASAGTLTILVGGSMPVFEECLPMLRMLGEEVSYLGSHGAGYSAKIAQVVLCYIHSLALSEALLLGVKGGVGAAKMLDIIRTSTGKSYVSDRYGPCILSGDYDPSFTLGLALKDMRLARDAADRLDLSLPMCDLATSTYSRAVEAFGLAANHLKAVRLLEQDSGTFLRG